MNKFLSNSEMVEHTLKSVWGPCDWFNGDNFEIFGTLQTINHKEVKWGVLIFFSVSPTWCIVV